MACPLHSSAPHGTEKGSNYMTRVEELLKQEPEGFIFREVQANCFIFTDINLNKYRVQTSEQSLQPPLSAFKMGKLMHKGTARPTIRAI